MYLISVLQAIQIGNISIILSKFVVKLEESYEEFVSHKVKTSD